MCLFLCQHVAVSCGSSEEDFTKLKKVTEVVPDLLYICLDVANGYSEHFVDSVRKTREEFAKHTLMVREEMASDISAIYPLSTFPLPSLPPSLPPSFPPSLPPSLLLSFPPSFPPSLPPFLPHSLPPSLPQAGNVVTGEMVEELLLTGADIIKVGIGPGMQLVRGSPFSPLPPPPSPSPLPPQVMPLFQG